MNLVPEEELNSLLRFREQHTMKGSKTDSSVMYKDPLPIESKIVANAVQHVPINTDSLLDNFPQGGGMRKKAQIIQKIKELYDPKMIDWNLHNQTLTIEGAMHQNVDFVKILKRLITPLPQKEVPGQMMLIEFFSNSKFPPELITNNKLRQIMNKATV